MGRMTVAQVKEIVEGKTVMVSGTKNDFMRIDMTNALMIADPDHGRNGRIVLVKPGTGCRIEMEYDGLIDSISGNKSMFEIRFSGGAGSMDVTVCGDVDCMKHKAADRNGVCQFIKEKLDRLSELTIEDIGLSLNTQTGHFHGREVERNNRW